MGPDQKLQVKVLLGRATNCEEEGKAVMADGERKGLVWSIKKSLLMLTADELFQLARSVGPVPGKDASKLQVGDEESCFEYILAFMNSDTLVESEDSGMVVLLELNDTVNNVIQIRYAQPQTGAGKDVHHIMSTSSVLSESITVGQPETVTDNLTTDNVTACGSNTNPSHTAAVSVATPSPITNPSFTHTDVKTTRNPDTELQRMLSSYAELSNKVLQYINNPTSSPTHTPAPVQSTLQYNNTHTPEQHPHGQYDRVVPLRDLSLLRREFKIQGGQIGDQSSDLSYNSICRQIDEGVKERFSETEILRAVLRVIKSGNFKDMLMHKDDLTIDELKGFLQSHLGGRSNTELFQELMCTKQNDSETPQQFLYRVIGLKQKILFASKYADTEVKYNANTVQDIFLHAIYQGLSHKHNDIRRELKPFLSDSSVTDETILKQMMKMTNTENERQRRLGSVVKQKQVSVHSTGLEVAAIQGSSTNKDAVDKQPKADALQQLTEKVEELMKKVELLQRPQRIQNPESCHHCQVKGDQKKTRSYSCANCLEQNRPGCTHCFHCGEDGHRAVGCLKKLKRPENWSRSLPRDKQ